MPQHHPASGWVEHDPEDIWRDTLATARAALATAALDASAITAIGIANQRETTLVWDRATGVPIHRAIVWQDRRTAERCRALQDDGAGDLVRARTGLLLDPYFSAAKIAWILDAVPGARGRAERGELAFGTVDSFLLWRLTGGRSHGTDITNAARTSLYDIHRQCWDDDLCRLFGVPAAMLPAVHDNAHLHGCTAPDLLGSAIPIAGIAGDQQAALFGQACFTPGSAKSTYGTGCFMLLNTGARAIASRHRLLTTPAYRLEGQIAYALEGSIFVAGAAVRWLRDGLGIIAHADETAALATRLPVDHGVYMVPAFVGMGAPHWDTAARGAVHGLTFDSGPAHLARAALEAAAFQTLDLIEAMAADGGDRPATLRIDGGMAANDWLCGFLADVIGTAVERPADVEATARGAAFHAGLGAGVWSGLDQLARLRSPGRRFRPEMTRTVREALVAGWRDAVGRTVGGHAAPTRPDDART